MDSRPGKFSKPGGHRRGGKSGRGKPTHQKTFTLSAREEAEIVALKKRVDEVMPAPGSAEIEFTEFKEMPLSRYTQNGLNRAKFTAMTQIQRAAIMHALGGRDILGAAKTGSGKTLAFIIPLLENLYHARWTATDGVGAIVISPTRELAMQIFEVLRTVGQAHFSLSAGLITGGKDFAEEQAAIGRMSILVATPGRLLQHLEQSPDLDVSGLRMLIMDEADRLLDMGFADTVNSIMASLPAPPQRQTLLFSATQTKSVRDLARLSLRDPEYVAVHDKAESATPSRLTQHYVACATQDKLNLLFSFLRSHTHNKIIVFVSSCKQSRFLFEAFRRLRPGIPLHLLHGKMKQARRMLVYYDFLKKPDAAMFATDIAARGLDFTGVDWVVQLDCPEDPATYIHRVGRTARFTAKGHALCVLTPGEAKGFVPMLQAAKVPIQEIRINPNSAVSVTGKLAAEVAADPTLKQLAQRSFLSYLRSIALQRNKEVFNAAEIDLDALAESMGLASTPEVKIARYSATGEAGAGLSLADAAKLTPEQQETMRKEAHSRKNSNKALSKLKEKIAAEKAARRAAAGGPALADSDYEEDDEEDEDGLLGTDSEDDDEDEEEDDEEEEEEEEEDSDSSDGRAAAKKAALKKAQAKAAASAAATAKASKGGAGAVKDKAARKAEEVEEDDLLVRKKSAPDFTPAEMAAALRISDAELSGMNHRERARVLRIVTETRAMAREAESGGVGEDGMTPFQRIAMAKKAELAGAAAAGAGSSKLTDAFAAHTAKLASRLAATAERDKEADRVRVREKHRREKMAAKGQLDEDEEEGEGDEEEDGEGVRLGGADSDEDGSGGDSDSDSEDGGSSSDEDEDEEMEERPKARRQMVAVAGAGAGSKRGREEEEEEDVPPSRSRGSKNGSAAAGATSTPSVEDLEAMALQAMQSKSKKARLA